MRRSKLEVYVDILHAISCTEQLKITHIMHKSNINGAVLKGHLDFLINNGMIEERKYKNSNFFALTEKGIKVLKSLREVEQMFFTEKTKTTFVAIHKQSKLLRESVR